MDIEIFHRQIEDSRCIRRESQQLRTHLRKILAESKKLRDELLQSKAERDAALISRTATFGERFAD